jgi:hypothetical protein
MVIDNEEDDNNNDNDNENENKKTEMSTFLNMRTLLEREKRSPSQ